MRLLMPIYHKLKVNLCLKTIPILSLNKTIDQWKGLGSVAGASIYGIAAGLSNPGKHRVYRTRTIKLSSTLGGLGCLNAGGMIQGESKLQKAKVYQEENKSVLTFDSSTVPSLKEPKTEGRCVKCKEQENRFFDEFFEHNFAKQAHWDAK